MSDPSERMGFWEWAREEPDRPALVGPEGERLTFGELNEDVNRLTNGLRSVAGLTKGDTLATVMSNSVAFARVYLAAMQSGLYLATLNYHSTASEIRYILEDCGARVVICSGRFVDVVLDASRGMDVAIYVDGPEVEGARSLDYLEVGQSPKRPDERPAGSVMQYTSGTTGRPKGVKRPLSGLDADAGAQVYRWIFDDYGMRPGEHGVWLVAAPMYHSSNISMAFGTLHLGYEVVIMDGWAPEKCLQIIEREGVTATHMVPTQLIRLLHIPDDVRLSFDVSSLRHLHHGAAPCPVDVKFRLFDWLGPVIYEYYGSTEVGSTMVRPEEWLTHPGTVGRPSSISELKILDEDGNEVPPGVVGQIYMRQGDDVMEYHNDPGKTAQMRRGRLLTVGDLGYVDEEGFLYLAGRAVELIISGGVNVYPAEVEGVLHMHPAVRDVAVIGQPDEDLGEVVVAVIELRDGVEPSDELAEAILTFAAQRLGRQKVPRQVRFVSTLPRDENGKVFKRKIVLD